MKLDSTDALAIQGLKTLHHAELQIGNALPEIISAASDPGLKSLLERSLTNSREHLNGLERVLAEMGEQPIGEVCETMEGLLADIELLIGEAGEPRVLDLALIGAMQQVGHFQIASYNSAVTLALASGREEAAQWLRQCLEHEKEADEALDALLKQSVHLPVEATAS